MATLNRICRTNLALLATSKVLLLFVFPETMLVRAKSSCRQTVTMAVSVTVMERGYVVNSSRLFLHSLVGASMRIRV